MVRSMTTNDETPETDEPETLDKSTVQGWVRETLEDILNDLPSDEDPSGEEESSSSLSVRQIEDAARKAVEEAMAPLLDAAGKAKSSAKKVPAKKVTKAKPADEESPAKITKSRLHRALWGED